MTWFTQPMGYEFFRHGLIVAMLVGGVCGLMGTIVVLRRMSYIGHGLSHSVFGGAVVAYLIGINFYIGAGLWGFLSALLINATARRRNIGADAAIGIVTTASFALGVALISRYRTFTRNFEAALFGNILGVTTQDIIVISTVTTAVVIAAAVFYRQLLFTSFDPELASIFGVPSGWVQTGFALAMAAVIVASMNIVGVTLIAAAIVIPPSTARLLTDAFGRMMIISTLIGTFCGAIGMFVSFHEDISSGAAIVLLNAVIFGLTYGGTALNRTLSNRPNPMATAQISERTEVTVVPHD
ncbi:MAG TPA: metal ABC transporter permease [Thermomicrobiales bacterium]|nr:metal ABC transporter permease [Thermomicrobiales bacterium]